MAVSGTRSVAHSMLAAVASRDVESVLACFTTDARWQNIPDPAAIGHSAIAAMLGPVLRRSDSVRWDIISESYEDRRAWLERVDRFWIDGEEYAVRCNAVLEFDPSTGLISELRDYVDLGDWRSRVAHIEF